MGKCKRRTLNSKQDISMALTRQQAVCCVHDLLNSATNPIAKKRTKNQNDFSDAQKLISLFGISKEELSEAGLSYEVLMALGNLVD